MKTTKKRKSINKKKTYSKEYYRSIGEKQISNIISEYQDLFNKKLTDSIGNQDRDSKNFKEGPFFYTTTRSLHDKNELERANNSHKNIKLMLTGGEIYYQYNIWNLKYFYDESDIVIIFNNVYYYLNKKIISESIVLKNLVYGGFMESNQEEIILDTDEITDLGWQYCLNYLYIKYYNSVKHNVLYPLIDISKLSNLDNIWEIYYASDYLIIDELVNEARNVLYFRLEQIYHDVLSDHRNADHKNINYNFELFIVNYFNNLPNAELFLQKAADRFVIFMFVFYLSVPYENINIEQEQKLVANIKDRLAIDMGGITSIYELKDFFEPFIHNFYELMSRYFNLDEVDNNDELKFYYYYLLYLTAFFSKKYDNTEVFDTLQYYISTYKVRSNDRTLKPYIILTFGNFLYLKYS